MFEDLRARTEIETIHEILEELDYYTLLQIPRNAPVEDISKSFREQTKALHPDRFFALSDADVRVKAQEVFRRINEAQRTLSDATMRSAYDESLRGGNKRLTTVGREEAARQKKKTTLADQVDDPRARKHWQDALREYKKRDFKSAIINAELALKYDPSNRTIAKWLMKARQMARANG